MKQWEYKTEKSDKGQTLPIDELNKLGAEGWELVNFSAPPPHYDNIHVGYIYHFKRLIS